MSEKVADCGSDLLAYFEIYCSAACMLKIGFKSTLAH
jgi:hypothetical protein